MGTSSSDHCHSAVKLPCPNAAPPLHTHTFLGAGATHQCSGRQVVGSPTLWP